MEPDFLVYNYSAHFMMAKMARRNKRFETGVILGTPLPDFDNPPVFEVVLSVQFEQVTSLTSAYMGLLWNEYQSHFPVVQTKAPIASAIEVFDSDITQQTKITLVEEPPTPRFWYESKDGTELIQVQQDRFIFNWKKVEGTEIYPRYEKVRSNFIKHFRKFKSFVKKHELGPVVPNQCEVTYVNHIHPDGVWTSHGQLGRVFSFWSGRHSDDFLSEPEDATVKSRYVMTSKDGEKVGRLNLSIEPRIKLDDRSSLTRLVLTARAKPASAKEKDVIEIFNLSREYVVRGFASVTTTRMHKVWKRNDV